MQSLRLTNCVASSQRTLVQPKACQVSASGQGSARGNRMDGDGPRSAARTNH
jgi:hypothetical protein